MFVCITLICFSANCNCEVIGALPLKLHLVRLIQKEARSQCSVNVCSSAFHCNREALKVVCTVFMTHSLFIHLFASHSLFVCVRHVAQSKIEDRDTQ